MCDKHDSVRLDTVAGPCFLDECIADLVFALQGLPDECRTVESCCGHGLLPGVINLSDGRALIVTDWYSALGLRQALSGDLQRAAQRLVDALMASHGLRIPAPVVLALGAVADALAESAGSSTALNQQQTQTTGDQTDQKGAGG